MKRIVPKSIRQKIIALTLGVSIGVLTACGLIFYLYESHSLHSSKERDSLIMARIIATNITAALTFGDVKASEEILAATKADPYIKRAQVINPDGSVFATYAAGGGAGTGPNSGVHLSAPIIVDGRTIGTISILRGLEDVAQSLDDLLLVGVALFAIAAIIALSIVSRLEAKITRPITHLADITRTVSENQDYSVRAIAVAQDETATLIAGFNRMLREIELRDNQLRAAHSQLEERVVERTKELQAEVSERRRTEEALAREQQQLRILIQNAPVSIAMFDPELRYLAHSNQWQIDFDTGDRSLNGQSHYAVFPDLEPRWRQIFSDALRGHAQYRNEDFVQIQGAKKHIRWSLQPWYVPNGAQGGVLMVAIVIDELVRAREDAFRVARIRTEFLANMSHELRTPLNGIIGFTELLLDNEHRSTEDREQLETIRASGKHLLNLVSEVLDFSKLESNRVVLEEIPFSLKDLVLDVTRALMPQAHEKSIDLISEVEPAIPVQSLGDPTKIRQVLMNLVGNAVKFTDVGSVRINARFEPIDENHGVVRFSICDSGIGIPVDKHESIFEPFVQADGSTTRRYGGTGLGLSICRRLAQLMHGTISVTSEPTRGSVFTFTCTIKNGSAATTVLTPTTAAVTTQASSSAQFMGLRVLIAEDNLVNQRLISAILTRVGVKATLVGNGQEALTKVNEEPFDLILMDLQMPLLGGIDATKAIRSQPAQQSIPIVALTAHAFPEDQDRCREAGMNGYLTKPIDRKKLMGLLESIVGDPSGRSISF